MYINDFETECCTCVRGGTCFTLSCDIPTDCDDGSLLYDTTGGSATLNLAYYKDPENSVYAQSQAITGSLSTINFTLDNTTTASLGGKYYYSVIFTDSLGCSYELCSGCIFVKRGII